MLSRSVFGRVLFNRGLYRGFSTTMQSRASVAVVLSGSGVFDGTEVHEASAILVHLSRADANVTIYAPDIPQMHVINHAKGEEANETRNVLSESARIARGKIESLDKIDASSHDALFFPGGFGAAKNLSSFATDGVDMKMNEQVEKAIKEFHTKQKPIGLCCIAPVLAAKVIEGCEVTVGQDKDDGSGLWPYAGTAEAVQKMKAKHFNKNVDEIHIDQENRIVTTPAYMCDTKVHEVHDGIGKMVQAVLSLTK